MNAITNQLPWRRLLGLLLGMGFLSHTSCAALLIGGGAAAGIGGYAYLEGELKSTESASLDKVWTATLRAMQDLQFPVTTQEKDALSGEVIARTAQDKKVHIHLKALSENSTEVRIRVGTWGDEALSLVILDKLKQRL